jgi:hypothetical protein
MKGVRNPMAVLGDLGYGPRQIIALFFDQP